LTGAHVLDGKFVIDADGALIAETAKDTEPGKIDRRLAEFGATPFDARQLADNPAPFVQIFKEGCANYGHVLYEMLPKLLILSGNSTGPLNVLVPPEANWSLPTFQYVGDLLGLDLRFITTDAPYLYVDHLIVCTPVSQHNRRKSETTSDLFRLLIDSAPKMSIGTRNIYVTRGAGVKRSITNGARIDAMMEKMGYRIVDPGTLSFLDQVAIFSQSERVVGALGAGLSNVGFCPEGADVFMIDPGLYDFFFWDITCLRRQGFSWFFNKQLEMFDAKHLSSPYEIREESLRTALEMSGFA
jgi:capsular polysaccharide biosynthesis protein